MFKFTKTGHHLLICQYKHKYDNTNDFLDIINIGLDTLFAFLALKMKK